MTSELERSDQQRRNLTADVAHELRTPIHIIQGNLEGILDGIYAPSDDHIAATLEETRAPTRLVEDLQLIAAAETGQLILVMAPVDIPDLLADLVTSFGLRAETAGITLTATVPTPGSEKLTVRGDAGHLYQAPSNLVVNALRHAGAGVMVTLAAEPTATVFASLSPTPAPAAASPPRICPTSSTGSGGATAPAATTTVWAAGWASLSCANSSTRTAGTFR